MLLGCGARTGLVERDAEPTERDVSAPPVRSCWSEPNCIEADLVTPDGRTIAYRESAIPRPLTTKIWLEGAERDGATMYILVFRDVAAGVNHYDYRDGNVFAGVTTSMWSCPIHEDITIGPLDLSHGGITEGTFEGRLHDCEHWTVRNGRFRLTLP